MSLFEYLAIAFGLLFALAAMRLVGGLPAAIEPTRRYWVHLTMVVSLLLAITVSFWTFWSLNQVDWRFHNFLIALAIPGFMYFMVATLIPEDPAEIQSWSAYYYRVRVKFFIGMTGWGIATVLSSTINLELSFVHPIRIFQAIVLIVGVTGAVSTNRAVHGVLVLVMLAISLIMPITVAMQSAWLVEGVSGP